MRSRGEETRRSRGLESTRSSNQDTCQSRKAAANKKKERDFLPPNKTKPVAEAPCDALNAPQFEPIEIAAICGSMYCIK